VSKISYYVFLFLASLFLISATASVYAECTEPEWQNNITYSRGDKVTLGQHEWRAKRSNTDVTPGTHKPTWRDQGQCETTEPPPPPPPGSSNIQIFGVWHAGNHYADWAFERDMQEFDAANHWIIDRGDGIPSVNLVVLSFVHPMRLLNKTNDAATVNGVPRGMTQAVVDYFKNAGIRVMMSIGGITYTDAWDEALATDPASLAMNAAELANNFGVGIEIDYERSTGPNLTALDTFIREYRRFYPYDPKGTDHRARLTIDLAAGGRYLQDLNRYATIHWLDNAQPVLDYANAMVHRSSGSPANWKEHVNGMPTYDPVIPPKAPNRFTGGLFLKGNMDNCTDFEGSEQLEHAVYVQTVAPNGAGTSDGMLGYMFWAAGTPSARKNYTPTTPPNSCEGGMGVAAAVFDLDIPMMPLRRN
jgi:hypothetical protein